MRSKKMKRFALLKKNCLIKFFFAIKKDVSPLYIFLIIKVQNKKH